MSLAEVKEKLLQQAGSGSELANIFAAAYKSLVEAEYLEWQMEREKVEPRATLIDQQEAQQQAH